jgi:hypothetical protein
LWIFVVLGYVILSTSQNSGSAFELPLLPAICILAASVASRSFRGFRPWLAGVCVVAAAVSFAGASDGIPGVASASEVASVGPIHVVAFDDRGQLLRYASSTGGGCRVHAPCHAFETMPGETAYLAQWIRPSERMASFLHAYAGAHTCDPVVFFAVQDPLFNTNTVDLSYQLAFRTSLPTGLLKTPRDAGASLSAQLNDPEFGRPNVVITGPASPVSPRFSRLAGGSSGLRALRRDGFAAVGRIGLPDGRTMRVWWLERGPCGHGRP